MHEGVETKEKGEHRKKEGGEEAEVKVQEGGRKGKNKCLLHTLVQ